MTEEEIKGLQEEVEKLRKEKEDLNGELTIRNSRVVELEQSITTKDTEMAVLRQNETGLKDRLGSVGESLNQAVAGYRTLAVKTNPDVPAELIIGETIEAIDKAVEGAWALVSKVKDKLEKTKLRDSVPAGAPQRTPPDLSAMTPREKIQYGIGNKGAK